MKFEFSQRTFRNSVVVIAVISVLFALRSASSVLLPIITSIFIYVVFCPLLAKMEKRGVRHWVSVAVCTVALVLLVVLFLLVIMYTVDRLILTATEYADMADSIYMRIVSYFSERFRIENPRIGGNTLAGIVEYSVGYLKSNIMYFRRLLTSLLMILIYDFFLFLDHNRIKRIVEKRVSNHRVIIAIELTIRQVSFYMRVKFVISLLTAIVFFAVMALNGMRGKLVLTALVFMLNFIPTVGSVVSTMAVSVLAFLQFGAAGSLPVAVEITALCILAQFVIGNIIDPQFTGRRVRLSPLIVLMSLAIWGYLLGVVGMVLAVPITCMVKNFYKFGGMMR